MYKSLPISLTFTQSPIFLLFHKASVPQRFSPNWISSSSHDGLLHLLPLPFPQDLQNPLLSLYITRKPNFSPLDASSHYETFPGSLFLPHFVIWAFHLLVIPLLHHIIINVNSGQFLESELHSNLSFMPNLQTLAMLTVSLIPQYHPTHLTCLSLILCLGCKRMQLE